MTHAFDHATQGNGEGDRTVETNKCLESIIKWLTSLLGNELFILCMVRICICLESCLREKGTGEKNEKNDKRVEGQKEKENTNGKQTRECKMWTEIKTEKARKRICEMK